MPPLKNSRRQFLVEGKDDLHTVVHVVRHHGFDWDNNSALPFVKDCGGIEPLLDQLKLLLKNTSAYEFIGVVIDADIDCRARWNQVRPIFEERGFDCPTIFPSGGFVATNDAQDMRVGLWLMPDNQENGNLEDFVSHLVPDNDPTWIYCNDVVD